MSTTKTDLVSTTKADLAEALDATQAIIIRAKRALEIEAPEMARHQLDEAILEAQGHLAYAGDLSVRHIRELEGRCEG